MGVCPDNKASETVNGQANFLPVREALGKPPGAAEICQRGKM
jgi:hypothetical protein